MKRTRLSDQYSTYISSRIRHTTDTLIERLTTRLAEYLWLHYPNARRVLVTVDDVSGVAEPVQILDGDDKPLWSIDGPGWEPGGANGPLYSLEPGDAADRHGAIIHSDICTLGVLLPLGTQWRDAWPGRGIRSDRSGVEWEIMLPLSTDRRQLLVEQELDKEAEQA